MGAVGFATLGLWCIAHPTGQLSRGEVRLGKYEVAPGDHGVTARYRPTSAAVRQAGAPAITALNRPGMQAETRRAGLNAAGLRSLDEAAVDRNRSAGHDALGRVTASSTRTPG